MQTDLVTIRVDPPERDLLKRIALLNAALFSVLSGVRLIRVLNADYQKGQIQMLVEARPVRPRTAGRVSVTYKPTSLRERKRLIAAMTIH